jgi:hypothetical protein
MTFFGRIIWELTPYSKFFADTKAKLFHIRHMGRPEHVHFLGPAAGKESALLRLFQAICSAHTPAPKGAGTGTEQNRQEPSRRSHFRRGQVLYVAAHKSITESAPGIFP